MKFKLGLLVAVLVAGVATANAQGGGGGFQRATVEERVKIAHNKLDSAFKLEPAKLTKADEVFTAFYKSQDKAREEMMGGGERPSREAMMEKMQPITDARDKSLKEILSADQFKKWKEEIEPAMSPRRGGGGRPQQ